MLGLVSKVTLSSIRLMNVSISFVKCVLLYLSGAKINFLIKSLNSLNVNILFNKLIFYVMYQTCISMFGELFFENGQFLHCILDKLNYFF